MSTETDYAYLAGLIDGDGYFFIYRQKPCNRHRGEYQRGIRIIGVWSGALVELATKSNAKVYRRNRGSSNRQDLYVAQWQGHSAAVLAVELLPYLRLKRQQAEILIAFTNTYSGRKFGNGNVIPIEVRE